MNRLALLCACSSLAVCSAIGQDLSSWPTLPEAEQLKMFAEMFSYTQGHEYFNDWMDLDDPVSDYATLATVKKAAIIAFNINLDMNSNVAGRTTTLGRSERVDVSVISEMVDSMYYILRKNLEGVGIELVPPATVTSSPGFDSLPSNDPWKLALYGEKWQTTAHAFGLKNIDTHDAFNRSDEEEAPEALAPFRRLASTLGVDALVVASSTVVVDFSGSSIESTFEETTWEEAFGYTHEYKGVELEFLDPGTPDVKRMYIASIGLKKDVDLPDVDMESDLVQSLLRGFGGGDYDFNLVCLKPTIITGYDNALSVVMTKMKSDRQKKM